MLLNKTVQFSVTEKQSNGGRIVISTGSVDRDKDRVFPQGGKTENYLKSPVVLWGHNYMDPWAMIGTTRTLEVSEAGLVAEFDFREPANDSDPLHIIRSLWDQDILRAASIGFRPETTVMNDFGGLDFVSWELLEYSLVTIGANQDALRLAAKSFPGAFEVFKRGRVLSAKNESRIRSAYDALGEVLGELADDDDKAPSILMLKQAIDVLTARVEALKAPTPPADDLSPLFAAVQQMGAAIRRKE